MSFINFPPSKPAALVRLPPGNPLLAAINSANAANSPKSFTKRSAAGAAGRATAASSTDEDRTSESDTANQTSNSDVSLSVTSARTAETADTEVLADVKAPAATQPTGGALLSIEEQAAADKKRAKNAARKQKKRALASAAAVSSTAVPNDESALAGEDAEEEDDGRAALASRMRRASVASSSASGPATASTSRLPDLAQRIDWSADNVEGADLEEFDFNEPVAATPSSASLQSPAATTSNLPKSPSASRQNYSAKLASDPSFTPRIGKFWSHDERLMEPDLRNISGWWKGRGPGSSNAGGLRSRRGSIDPHASETLSRRPSSATGSDFRPASPAGSSGGWQEVTKPQKRFVTSGLAPKSAFAPQPAAQEDSTWKHDRFEDRPGKGAKNVWGSTSYTNFNNARDSDPQGAFANKTRVPFAGDPSRPPEPPWTARSPVPYLYNEPGSRVIVEENTGRKMCTLRISLKPIPDLLRDVNRRMARQRANVVEIDCYLHFDEEWPRPTAAPISDDTVFIIKLSRKAKSLRVYTAAGEAKRQAAESEARRKAAEDRQAELESKRADEQQAEAAAEEKRQRDAEAAQERAKEQARVARELAEEEASRRPTSSMSVLYTAKPSSVDGEAPSEVPAAVQEQRPPLPNSASSAGPPQTESASSQRLYEQQPVHYQQQQQLPPQQHLQEQQQQHQFQQQQQTGYYMYGPPQPQPGQPPFMSMYGPPQPFVGPDGAAYFFDPSSGQTLPYHPSMFEPSPMHFGPPPGFYGEPSGQQLNDSAPHMSNSGHPAFFAPPRSHRLEIKAPQPGELAKRTRKDTPTNSAANRFPRPTPSPGEGAFVPSSDRDGAAELASQDPMIPGSYHQGGAVFFQPQAQPFFATPPGYYGPPPNFYPSNGTGFQDPAILAMSASAGAAPFLPQSQSFTPTETTIANEPSEAVAGGSQNDRLAPTAGIHRSQSG